MYAGQGKMCECCKGVQVGNDLACKVLASVLSKGKVQRSTNPSLPPSVLFLNTTPATLKEHKNILGLPGLAPNFTDMYALLVGTV